MNLQKPSRRSWLAKAFTLVGSTVLAKTALARTMATPKSTEGPFYPTSSMRPADVDNDLVKVEGAVTEAGGEIFTLKGKLSNRSGQAIGGARVEIWQCDVNGRYLHTADSQRVAFDSGFQGFGHDITNESGEYVFRTIKPTKYPGRTPHIHVKVFIDGKEVLTSQFYVEGEPSNRKDRIFRRLSKAEAETVSMRYEEIEGVVIASVNVVV